MADVKLIRDTTYCPECHAPGGSDCTGMDSYSVHPERVVRFEQDAVVQKFEVFLSATTRYAFTLAAMLKK